GGPGSQAAARGTGRGGRRRRRSGRPAGRRSHPRRPGAGGPPAGATPGHRRSRDRPPTVQGRGGRPRPRAAPARLQPTPPLVGSRQLRSPFPAGHVHLSTLVYIDQNKYAREITTGRSGRTEPVAQRLPGGLRGLLFGLLLAAALAGAEFLPGHPHRRGEVLLVVRTLLGDEVLRHAEPVLRGEFLQAGL